MQIKASENNITPGTKLELVAIRQLVSKRTEIANVMWDFSPKHKNLSLHENKLLLSSPDSEIDEITVFCTEPATGLIAERKFKINQQKRYGKLVHFIRNDNNYSGDEVGS